MPDSYPTSIADKPWLHRSFDQLAALSARGNLAHSMLLAGAVGVGKLHLAQALAQMLLCVSPNTPKPCGKCSGCALVLSGNHPDLMFIQPAEGRQVTGVDAIREMGESLMLKSHQGNYRVLIFPELADMTMAAANSLLKMLEEPPPGTFFLCCSAKPGLLLPTIRSRLQLFRIKAPARSTTLNWLHQQHNIDKLDAENHLTLAQGAPLQIVAMLGQECSEQRQQVFNLLMFCHQGISGSLHTVIRKLCTYALRDNLKLIHACMYDILQLHYNHDTDPALLNFRDKTEQMTQWSRNIQPRHLFIVYDQLLAVQDACVKNIAVNQQLQLFNLAMLLHALLRKKPQS